MRRVTRITLVLLGTLALFMLTTASSCDSKQDVQRRNSVRTRADAFARAERAVPVPKTENFPLRKTLAVMTERDDQLNHPWYVYILGMNGNVIGYYVAKTDPINACDFLSSTEDAHDGYVLTAPSLDGIFYGGSGSTSGCDAWVFLDAATDALIKIRGMNFYAADQPLRLEADPIRVKGQ